VLAIQKLVRNGSSTQVTIPRCVLIWLGWQTGQAVAVEILEDKTLHIRRPTTEDFLPQHQARVVLEHLPAVKP
jgi:antitoxin component of MazEF toxin-antitoxin module